MNDASSAAAETARPADRTDRVDEAAGVGGTDRADRGSGGSDAEPVAVGDLRVEADLELSVDGEPVRVRSGAGRLELSVDRLATLRTVAALRGRLPGPIGGALDGAPLGFAVRGVEVARVDPGVPAGPLSRALGVAPIRIDPRGVVRALAADARESLRRRG